MRRVLGTWGAVYLLDINSVTVWVVCQITIICAPGPSCSEKALDINKVSRISPSLPIKPGRRLAAWTIEGVLRYSLLFLIRNFEAWIVSAILRRAHVPLVIIIRVWARILCNFNMSSSRCHSVRPSLSTHAILWSVAKHQSLSRILMTGDLSGSKPIDSFWVSYVRSILQPSRITWSGKSLRKDI